MSVIESACRALQSIEPQDMRDAEFFCSTLTWHMLRNETRLKPDLMPDVPGPADRLFGRPLRIDESVPPGEVRALAETEWDRMLRRAARDGRYVNVVKPVDLFRLPPSPPEPTVKALIKHWWRKLKRS